MLYSDGANKVTHSGISRTWQRRRAAREPVLQAGAFSISDLRSRTCTLHYLSFDRSKPGTCPGTKQRFFATFPSSACPIRTIHELVWRGGQPWKIGLIKIPRAWNWHRVANRLRSSCIGDYCHREKKKKSTKSKMCQLWQEKISAAWECSWF